MVDKTTDIAHEQFATASAQRTTVVSHFHLRQTCTTSVSVAFAFHININMFCYLLRWRVGCSTCD